MTTPADQDDNPARSTAPTATSAADASDDAARHMIPRQTTPTWEMELLISGLTVFALLQLPGLLDEWFYALFVRVEMTFGMLIMLVYMYLKGAVLALALTFISHLVLRGYWVALIGMRSAYPGGVRWDAIKHGPQMRRVIRETQKPQDVQIERADNRATAVFAIGVGLAMVMLTPMLPVVVVFGLTLLLSWLVGPDVSWLHLFAWGNALVMGPFLLAYFVDKLLGERLAADGMPARIVRTLLRGYATSGFSRATSPLLVVFQSHFGTMRTTVVMMTTMLVLFGAVFMQLTADLGIWRLDAYRYVPVDEMGSARTLRAEHYATTREVGMRGRLVPYIQAEVIRGPYVRLYVPYEPERHNDVIEADCGGVPAARAAKPDAEARRREDLLACVARLHAVQLDGKDLAVRYDFATDRGGRGRGFVAMIDVRALAAGEHEIVVARPRRVDASPGDTAPAPAPSRIPFWR